MKVRELIAALSERDGDEEVYLAQQSGDYWRTVVFQPITDVYSDEVVADDYYGDGMFTRADEADDGLDIISIVALTGGGY